MIELVEQLDANQVYKRLVLSLLESENLDDIVWKVAQEAIGKLGFEDCVVYILDNHNTLIQRAAFGPKNPDGREIKTPITIPLGEGIVGTVAKTGIPERIDDTRQDPRYIVDDEIRLSELTVPIVYNGKILGVLDSENSQVSYFTDAHLEQFITIAKLAAPKIFHALAAEHLAELNRTLQDSNTRYQHLIEQSPDAIVVHQHGRIVYYNGAFASMVLSLHGELLLQREIWDFIPEQHHELFCKSLENQKDFDTWCEIELTTRYCTRVSVSSSSVTIPFKDGHEAIQTIFHDISVHKRKQRELEIASENAETANKIKNQFLSRISHELRTPLNAIIGFAQLQSIKFPDLPEEANHFTDEILTAGEHLLALVNDILDISQVEQKQLPIKLVDCDLYPVLESCISLIKRDAEKNKIEVICNNFDYQVVADPMRLKQVLVNLLSNAVKYNHANGKIIVQAQRVASNAIELQVTDTGIGIAADEMEHIFQPFNRLKQAEQHHFEGAGVGLSLTHSLLQEMHGSIRVESEPGKGSTFSVTLKTPESPLANTNEQVQRPELEVFTKIDLDLLYVEDDWASTELVKRVCALVPNVTLHTATDGMQGVELALNQDFDLIMLDMNLPDINGIEVLQKIRAAKPGSNIIALSADALPEQIDKAIAAGFDFYLTKPLHLPELLYYLRLLNTKQRSTQNQVSA